MIRLSQEQVDWLMRMESDDYISRLYDVIVRHSPSLSSDTELMKRLKDADDYVTLHNFMDKQVKTDFLIMNAFEPNFYASEAMRNWLLNGTESVESEYIKYKQIRAHLLERNSGGGNE